MTKRRLRRDLEALDDEVLADLGPAERHRWMLIAQIEGNDSWADRLRKTCPPDQLGQTAAWGHLSLLFAGKAVYDIHVSALRFKLLHTEQTAIMIADLRGPDSSSEEDDEGARAAKRADTIRHLFTLLYVSYHGYQRFAETILDLDLETWVSICTDGTYVLTLAKETLDNPTQHRLAEEWLAAEMPAIVGGSDADSLDELVADWYENRRTTWNRMLRGLTRF